MRWERWIRSARLHPGTVGLVSLLALLVGAAITWVPFITFSNSTSKVSFSISQYSGLCSSGFGQFAQSLDSQVAGGCAGATLGMIVAVALIGLGGLGLVAGIAIYSTQPADRPSYPPGSQQGLRPASTATETGVRLVPERDGHIHRPGPSDSEVPGTQPAIEREVEMVPEVERHPLPWRAGQSNSGDLLPPTPSHRDSLNSNPGLELDVRDTIQAVGGLGGAPAGGREASGAAAPPADSAPAEPLEVQSDATSPTKLTGGKPTSYVRTDEATPLARPSLAGEGVRAAGAVAGPPAQRRPEEEVEPLHLVIRRIVRRILNLDPSTPGAGSS